MISFSSLDLPTHRSRIHVVTCQDVVQQRGRLLPSGEFTLGTYSSDHGNRCRVNASLAVSFTPHIQTDGATFLVSYCHQRVSMYIYVTLGTHQC